jgi:hypothetical protein
LVNVISWIPVAGRLYAENVDIVARIGVSFATFCRETISQSGDPPTASESLTRLTTGLSKMGMLLSVFAPQDK